jgi:1-acyl-sn-glycerol-3-phosphate acyltransferase
MNIVGFMNLKPNEQMSVNNSSQLIMHDLLQDGKYHHANWDKQRRFLRFLLRTLGFTLLVRLEKVEGLDNIPMEGPGILLMNHIGWVDPIVLVHVMPRYIVPLAKVEVLEYPVIGIIPPLWGMIPVQREGFDRKAVQTALEILDKGEIVLVAPEGTRNPQLQKAKEGFAYLASRSGAPIIPVAIEGSSGYPTFRYSKRWRESPIFVKFGKPFYYRSEYERAGREQLRKLTDEAMYYLAEMLPEERRGYYSDLSKATRTTIREM